MGVQSSIQNKALAFILSGVALSRPDAIIAQDAGRGAVALVFGTLMAKIVATQKWVPFTNEAATDGSANPQGIYIGADIAGADLVAGDIVWAPILVGNAVVDINQIVIEKVGL